MPKEKPSASSAPISTSRSCYSPSFSAIAPRAGTGLPSFPMSGPHFEGNKLSVFAPKPRWLALLCLLCAAVLPALAAPAPDDSAPPVVTYPDLLVNLATYVGRTVTLKGSFHYMESNRPSFDLHMGEQTVSVSIVNLPPEAQASLRNLRDFSEKPLSVTGVVRQGAFQAAPILLLASSVEIAGVPTHFVITPSDGVVTYPQIERHYENFLNAEVTMKGRFDFRTPDRQMFSLWRGVGEIEVDFSKLPNPDRLRLLNEPDFSNQPLTVKGSVAPLPGQKGSYLLLADSLVIPPPPTAGAVDPAKKGLTGYGDLLAAPTRYLNHTVRMKGAYDLASDNPYTFQMRQDDDTIEVLYSKIDPQLRDQIAAFPDFSGITFYVTGTIHAYPDAPNRFFLVADKIEIVSE